PSPSSPPPVSAIASNRACAQPCSTSRNASAVPGTKDAASARASAGSKPGTASPADGPTRPSVVNRDDTRREPAKIFVVVVGGQLPDRAVLVLRDEQQVEQAQHPPGLQPVDFSQDPALEVGAGTEVHSNHLQWTRHGRPPRHCRES